MNYVVGSGPSGVAAASALLERGLPVTMLDVGRELEPDRAAALARLGALEPAAFDPELLARLRGPSILQGVPVKTSYGSEFPYAKDEMASVVQHGTSCLQSFAKGGLSNVWGAAVLPARREDLDGWPVAADELAPHYAAVARRLRIAGARDGLEPWFPFYEPPAKPAPVSAQARALLERMQSARDALRSAGIVFGQSRLAVRTEASAGGRACESTGLCLSGCPYGAIWSSAQALEELRQYPDFTYRGGWIAARVSESGGKASVECRFAAGGPPATFEGDRVFLAAGALSTTRIVLESLGPAKRQLELRFQPYFLLPLLAKRNVDGVSTERLHTLAQIFLDIEDPALSARTVHLQVYTYNEHVRDRLGAVASRLGPLGPALRRAFEGRLLIMQGYLHSSEAPGIAMSSSPGRLELTSPDLSAPRATIRRVVRKLSRNASLLGMTPLWPWLHVGAPGEGNHIGGQFPMRRQPGAMDTDVLGRLTGMDRVHIVDASVLPDLPATTFTYTMMANAHRIASQAARL